jgi:hypothetical protein
MLSARIIADTGGIKHNDAKNVLSQGSASH